MNSVKLGAFQKVILKMYNSSIYVLYLKQILKHKKYVFEECKACGIIWQGIVHDLSKFSKQEFTRSARRYFGENTQEVRDEYIEAWMHHKGCNPHHWEYWTDYDIRGDITTYKIPYNYVIEMVCDWIGAGKAYEKEEWNQAEPLEYYNKVRAGRHFHKDTEELILKLLNCIKTYGLDEFHKFAKNSVLKEFYESREGIP